MHCDSYTFLSTHSNTPPFPWRAVKGLTVWYAQPERSLVGYVWVGHAVSVVKNTIN